MIRRIPTSRSAFPRAMTVICIVVVAVLSAVALSGCDDKQDEQDKQKSRIARQMNIYTDPLTQCQYLSGGDRMDGHSLTPRLGRDGKQICN